MSREDENDDRNPIERIAAEFVERLRTGGTPTVEEYAEQYPDLAADIRELLPTVVAMEKLKLQKEQPEKSRFLKGVTLKKLGDYLILGEIGRGGMGIVYEAEQQSLGRHVAVKVMPRQSLLEGHRIQRFAREAQTAARLHHTNIVPIFGVGEQDGYHYYVMQFIRGLGLDRIIRELRGEKTKPSPGTSVSSSGLDALAQRAVDGLRTGKFQSETSSSSRSVSAAPPTGPTPSASIPAANAASPASFSPGPGSADPAVDPEPTPSTSNGSLRPLGKGREYWRSVARIGVQVADALEYAHSHGTLHRDIKPANLLLDGQGVVWVTDFGLAKAMEDSDVTNSGDVVGTLQYMAPEQFFGEYDARSDVYCLGLTLYELLTLRPAFAGSNRSALMQSVTEGRPVTPRRLVRGIPADLETIVLKAINRDPRHRYQSAEELREDMQRYLEDRPILARRTTPIQHLRRWCRRNRALTAALSVAAVAILSGSILGWWLYAKESSTSKDLLDSKQTLQAVVSDILKGYEGIIEHVTGPDLYQAIVRNTATAATESSEAKTYQSISIPVASAREAQLLEVILDRYTEFAKNVGDHPDLKKDTAWAYHKIGEYRVRLGELQKGADSYIKAILRYTELDSELFAVQIATIRNQLGQVYAHQNQLNTARESYALVLEELEDELGNSRLTSGRARYELALAHDYLGTLGTQSDTDRERPRGDRSRPRRGGRPSRGDRRGLPGGRRWPSRSGGRRPLRFDPIVGLDRDAREFHHRRAQRLFFQLVEDEPDNLVFRLGLARSDRNYYGFLFSGRTRSMRSNEDRFTIKFLIDEATSTLKALSEEHKDSPLAQYCQYELAETLAMLPVRENRERIENEALKIALDLTANNPTVPSYRFLAASIHHLLASYHHDRFQFDEEEKHLQAGIELGEKLVQDWPENWTYLKQLADLRDPYIQRLRRSDLDAASSQADTAVREVTAFLEQTNGPKTEYRLLAQAYWSQCEVLHDLELTTEAEVAAELARDAESKAK